MSAATMVACAANQIVMESIRFSAQSIRNSYCKPRSAIGWFRFQNILEQFERALRDGADPVKLRVWASSFQMRIPPPSPEVS
jgi:hypothetical protein